MKIQIVCCISIRTQSAQYNRTIFIARSINQCNQNTSYNLLIKPKKMTLISFFICPILNFVRFSDSFSALCFERWNSAFEFNYNFNGCHKVLMGDLIQSLLNLSIKRSINSNINKGTTHLKVGCFYKQDVTKQSFCQAVKKLSISNHQ